jgi:hypothetical protein
MKTWYRIHPGGQFTFCAEANVPLDENMTNHHIGRALHASKWQGKLTGWHVFRHSFASL